MKRKPLIPFAHAGVKGTLATLGAKAPLTPASLRVGQLVRKLFGESFPV